MPAPGPVDIDIPAGINEGETVEIRLPNPNPRARGGGIRVMLQARCMPRSLLFDTKLAMQACAVQRVCRSSEAVLH